MFPLRDNRCRRQESRGTSPVGRLGRDTVLSSTGPLDMERDRPGIRFRRLQPRARLRSSRPPPIARGSAPGGGTKTPMPGLRGLSTRKARPPPGRSPGRPSQSLGRAPRARSQWESGRAWQPRRRNLRRRSAVDCRPPGRRSGLLRPPARVEQRGPSILLWPPSPEGGGPGVGRQIRTILSAGSLSSENRVRLRPTPCPRCRGGPTAGRQRTSGGTSPR